MRSPTVLRALGVAAALLVTAPALAAGGVDITQATEEQKKQAQDHYQKGTKAFEAKQFKDAYAEFSASYDVVRSPNAHMMMARALVELGQHARAYNELGLVEEETQGQEKYAATIEKARALRADAAKKIAVVTIKLAGDQEGPLQTTLDDLVTPVDKPYGVAPGKATVRAFRGGKLRDVEELSLKEGETRTVELDLGPADPKEAPLPPVLAPQPVIQKGPAKPVDTSAGSGMVVAGSVITALGIGGFAVGGALYKLSSDDYAELVARCGGDPALGEPTNCGETPEVADLKESGKDKQTFATAALVAGGVATALGLGLIMGGAVIGYQAGKEAEKVSFELDLGPGGVWMTGTF